MEQRQYKDISFPWHFHMIKVLELHFAGVSIYIAGFSPEPYTYFPNTGSSMPYQIQIKSYSYEKLLEFSKNYPN